MGPQAPTDQQKELAKQLVTYADAITAFAFVQSVAFGFALGQHELRDSVLKAPGLVFLIIAGTYLLYGYFVRKCREGECALLGGSADAPLTNAWKELIWNHRFGVLALGAVLSLIALVATVIGACYDKKF